MTAQLLQLPEVVGDGAGAPIVTVSAKAGGASQSAMANPMPARNPFCISHPSPGVELTQSAYSSRLSSRNFAIRR